MQQLERQFSVTWRGKIFTLKMKPSEKLKELGDKLQAFTSVKAETLRLIIPMKQSSKIIYPFSDEQSHVSLEAASIFEGVSIRMMGVPENEVDEVLQNSKADLRIAGFDDEEQRMRRRMSYGKSPWPTLPQGTYLFSEFRTLHLPGIELSPPASEALKLMHRLAADPGIVAIMNKHRWRVGIMTELAPVGYVGVSPKCILGFNKNHGEEISLRLRTDDLNGFRKYESIKKTLLHELAHMVYSEHDANFYALDKQLNQEAATLDWTKSKAHSLSAVGHPRHSEEEITNGASSSRKLGGSASAFPSARTSSVAAAYRRSEDTLVNSSVMDNMHEEPDPDDSNCTTKKESNPMDAGGIIEAKNIHVSSTPYIKDMLDVHQNAVERVPFADVIEYDGANRNGQYFESKESGGSFEQNDDSEGKIKPCQELFPRNDLVQDNVMVCQSCLGSPKFFEGQRTLEVTSMGTDPDESGLQKENVDQNDLVTPKAADIKLVSTEMMSEHDPDESTMTLTKRTSVGQAHEPDPDDEELRLIHDPVSIICDRLQNAREKLRSEMNLSEAASVLLTIIKIIKNVIDHPEEIKFRRLRKANPIVQRNITSHRGAMEIMHIIGFSDEIVYDEQGKPETYLALKRNDLGLLWLAKTLLESSDA